MLNFVNIQAQSSFHFFNGLPNKGNSIYNFYGFEYSPGNFLNIKDWEFSLIYGGELRSGESGNLYQISIAKKIEKHNFTFRYTPGYRKNFIFSSGLSLSENDSLSNLKSSINYEENFAAGYSYQILKNLSAGVSLRYFTQDFTNENIVVNFNDSATTINPTISNEKYGNATGNIGITYNPFVNLKFDFSIMNFINTIGTISEEYKPYELVFDEIIQLGVDYRFNKNISTRFIYESNSSLELSAGYSQKFESGSLNFGLTAFHDKYQEPYFAGIVPLINYSNDKFSLTLGAVKYFSDRNKVFTSSFFNKNKVHNIINNQFSTDKIFASVNFALNTFAERKVKILEVEILENVYPSLPEFYVYNAFAKAKIFNLTNKQVLIKPLSKIDGINDYAVQSPAVNIAANDTAEVFFYTLIKNNISPEVKIAQVNFIIQTLNNKIDDEFQVPILINDKNSWNGRVKDLQYFVERDLDHSAKTSKKIISEHKNRINSVPDNLKTFETVKILFENFIGKMSYVSDPRAAVDKVQFPIETFELKGGDCDDLSVAFSSLLESIGIETAFVDYRNDSTVNHVNLMINTGLKPEEANLITVNDKKYFIRKNLNDEDEVWVPLEITSLTDFETAWQIASEKFYNEAIEDFGLVKGNVQIINIF